MWELMFKDIPVSKSDNVLSFILLGLSIFWSSVLCYNVCVVMLQHDDDDIDGF